MITLIKNGEVYSPDYLGKQSILVFGDEIVKIDEVDEDKLLDIGLDVTIIDAENAIVTPGLIDPHVHLIGGGGEGGFATRTPEIQLSDIINSGITTVVGLLGTDGTTRHMTSLLAKARGLEEEGLTTYIYSGNYHVPTPFITSSIKDDVILIDKVIGAGEIAISDSRSAQPSLHELAKLVSEARIGGLLSGKAGVTHFHVGPGKEKLSLLHQLIDNYEIPPSKLYATHINRSKELIDDAISLSKKGSFVDITAGDETGELILYFKNNGGDLNQLTLSSDGNGSLPKFNLEGELIGFGIASPKTLYQQVISAVIDYHVPLSEALSFVTSNTAEALNLPKKGQLREHGDADILILDRDTLQIEHAFAKGKQMIMNKETIVKGTFEI
ncbi:beta-aspartyl-dipeptidase (metallo-type) [Virgibacillus natechei]|uniref:Isoaspartyl dipeptidase n=1 Tax=Virgibacillus natechei TaxID=1216297 RepID=A0ABS4IGY3_9BACI|nr:beta-aspartyl-peptidase [Virgibacillus natechei]MBP1970203.1 beta-aspartyl-dipeptidase (metallo-type) [Virgibacillus natechei]UZD12846.1 beta-aspartyl-peptidase [Virgibacillus natechei]